jgi:hypothetical protein
MKLLIMQLFLTSSNFIPLRSKYTPQHPVLVHPQSMVPPLMLETTLHTYTEPQAKLSPSALHFKIEHNGLFRRMNLYAAATVSKEGSVICSW